MTYAPASYRDAQALICARTGLPAVSVGIVGDAAHGTSGYHLGWDRIRLGRGLGDYSYRESARDRAIVDDAASAIDVGWFTVTINRRTITLLDFNRWLITQCQAGAPDTQWIREVIYTPDRVAVKRWDRLGIRTTGDTSHLGHTHLSGFRDAENVAKRPLFARFFAEMAGARTESVPTPEGDDMFDANDRAKLDALFNLYPKTKLDTDATPDGQGALIEFPNPFYAAFAALSADVKASRVAVEALAAAVKAGGGDVSTAAVLAHMDDLAAADTEREQQATARIAALEAEIGRLRQAAAAGAKAEADALGG